jgi:hypothetical protein
MTTWKTHWRVDYIEQCFTEKQKFRTRAEARKCARELRKEPERYFRIEITGPYDAKGNSLNRESIADVQAWVDAFEGKHNG